MILYQYCINLARNCVPRTVPTVLMSDSLERLDASDPQTWTMKRSNVQSLEQRCLAGLRKKGYPATSVEMDPSKLKGGYICDTMRVFIGYGKESMERLNARVEAEARREGLDADQNLPKSTIVRPATAILKIASPQSNDHDVALRLRLYEREWHFYETLSERVPVRVPAHLGSVKDEATGLITEGVLLEDLEVPGAVLCPKLDDDGVLKTVSAIARQHAQFWNMPELTCGALGIKPHNSPWYQPAWGNDIAGYWPRFEEKWRARGPSGDANGPGLPEEAYTVGKRIVESFAWVQDELSSKPHTFNHGDVKPPNMFMMPGSMPAFIDWQYTAVGKGCQDLVFFLIEGYEIAECRRLEPVVMVRQCALRLALHGVSAPAHLMCALCHLFRTTIMHVLFTTASWTTHSNNYGEIGPWHACTFHFTSRCGLVPRPTMHSWTPASLVVSCLGHSMLSSATGLRTSCQMRFRQAFRRTR